MMKTPHYDSRCRPRPLRLRLTLGYWIRRFVHSANPPHPGSSPPFADLQCAMMKAQLLRFRSACLREPPRGASSPLGRPFWTDLVIKFGDEVTRLVASDTFLQDYILDHISAHSVYWINPHSHQALHAKPAKNAAKIGRFRSTAAPCVAAKLPTLMLSAVT